MRGSAPPLWLWILALIAVGSFVTLVGYMERYQANNPPDAPKSDSGPKKSSQPSSEPTGADSDKSTRFDFYNLLPELESLIPERNVPVPASKEPPVASTLLEPPVVIPTPEPLTPTTGRYYLQAGSFKDFQAADSRRASLALMGVESSIQKANIPNRGLWYRVRIGPFKAVTDMRETRKQLNSQNIQSIMLTVKE